MKTKITLAATIMALLSIAGCASQSQVNDEAKQLASMQATLVKIQAAQAESLALQKTQASLQIESKNIQAMQYQRQFQND